MPPERARALVRHRMGGRLHRRTGEPRSWCLACWPIRKPARRCSASRRRSARTPRRAKATARSGRSRRSGSSSSSCRCFCSRPTARRRGRCGDGGAARHSRRSATRCAALPQHRNHGDLPHREHDLHGRDGRAVRIRRHLRSRHVRLGHDADRHLRHPAQRRRRVRRAISAASSTTGSGRRP